MSGLVIVTAHEATYSLGNIYIDNKIDSCKKNSCYVNIYLWKDF